MDILQDLLVKITGDAKSYLDMLKQAGQATQATAGIVDKALKQFENFTGSITKFSQNATRALASLGAMSWLKQALGEFQHAELAALKLNAAMDAQGRQVDSLTKKYDNFANQMQDLTTVEDDNVRLMIAQAENMGLTADKAMRAVKNAIALASKAGDAGSAGRFIRITAALEEGRVIARAINPALLNVKDNTERVTKAQEMLAKMFKTAEAAAQSSSGSLKQLNIAYGNMLESFGKVVAQGIQPAVKWLRELIKWVETLPQSTREAIVLFASLAAGILALGPIVAGLTLLWASLMNPVVIGLAAIATGIVLWVRSMGGVEKSLTYIKEQFTKAWEWLLPIRQALESLWNQIVSSAEQAWKAIQDYGTQAWNALVTATGLSWDKIRSAIVDAILFAEFTLTHFKEVGDLLWAGMKYGVVTFSGHWKYLWDTLVPAGINWVKDNWPVIWHAVMEYMVLATQATFGILKVIIENSGIADAINKPFKAGFKLVWENAGSILANLADAARGKSFFDVWREGAADAKNKTVDLNTELAKIPQIAQNAFSKMTEFKLPEYKETMSERLLRREFERQKNLIGESFAEFRKKKLEEFAKITKVPDPKNDLPKWGKAGADSAKAFKAGMDSVSFALSGSFEALKNLEEYSTKLAEAREKQSKAHQGLDELGEGGGDTGAAVTGGGGVTTTTTTTTTTGGGGQSTTTNVTSTPPTEVKGTVVDTNMVLKEILAVLMNIDKKGGNPLKPANVAGDYPLV